MMALIGIPFTTNEALKRLTHLYASRSPTCKEDLHQSQCNGWPVIEYLNEKKVRANELAMIDQPFLNNDLISTCLMTLVRIYAIL